MRIAILGAGLLGGSLALDLVRRRVAGTGCGDGFEIGEVVLWARRAQARDRARELGIADRVTDSLAEACEAAEMVVICTPPSTIVQLALEAAGLSGSSCVITDVGSVKAEIVYPLQGRLPGGRTFIGSHPMAGGHESGIDSSRAELYRGASCFLTPLPGDDESVIAIVAALWQAVGCRVIRLSPGEHDRAVALMSHLPHAVAATLVNSVLDAKAPGTEHCGNGFRDTTRIAAGPPAMWTEIFLMNRSPLIEAVDALASGLECLRKALVDSDGGAIHSALSKAGEYRSRL